LSALLQMKPQEARLLVENGEERLVPVEQLSRGDRVAVRPGERIPADGKVVQGTSSVNEAALTGEAIPVDKKEGDDVLAGSINGHGALVLEVTRAGEESLFARMVRLVEEARREVPPIQRRMERLERLYAKTVVLATILFIMCSPFVWHLSWTESLYRGMVFLVVASPCALVASVMPAMLSAMSNGARNGVLLKSGIHLDTLADLSVIAFDKTGTLTEGKPMVTDVVTFRGWNEDEFLRCVASIESVSEHPVGRAVADEARKRGLSVGRPDQFRAVVGFGVTATWEGEKWCIGKPALFDGWERDPEIMRAVERMEQEGKTVVLAERNGEFIGMVAVMDTLRAEATGVVSRLKQLGLEVVMLTGDRESTARAIAREVGIDRVYADLLPEDKVRVVEELARRGAVAMVGDGVNDAPALARARLGIAMGGEGTDVALETADVVLMKDDLTKLPHLIRLGKRMKRIVTQNVAFALTVIVVLVLANFIRLINLPFGVVGHEGSTLLVILNGLRLLR
jgi:Cd2+/Zn2+-exporting ATPase